MSFLSNPNDMNSHLSKYYIFWTVLRINRRSKRHSNRIEQAKALEFSFQMISDLVIHKYSKRMRTLYGLMKSKRLTEAGIDKNVDSSIALNGWSLANRNTMQQYRDSPHVCVYVAKSHVIIAMEIPC